MPWRRGLLVSLNKVLATNAPVFQDVRVSGLIGEVRRPEVVLLPMKSPDRTATWVLNGVFYW